MGEAFPQNGRLGGKKTFLLVQEVTLLPGGFLLRVFVMAQTGAIKVILLVRRASRQHSNEKGSTMSDSRKRGKPTFHPDEDYGNAGTDMPGGSSDEQDAKDDRTVKALLLGFMCFFLGWIGIALTDPFHWGDDTMFFCAFGSFCLLLWCMAFFPVLFGKKKKYRSDLKGCFSLLLLGFGALSLFMFFVTKPETRRVTVTYFYKSIEGHAITDGLGFVPKSQSTGREVKISFQKQVDFSIRRYRFDQTGELQFDSELSSKHSPHLDTFEGETWVVTDMDDKPLYYYVAGYKGAWNVINLAVIPPASKVP